MRMYRYAEGSRRDGELSPSETASMLDIHHMTLRRWYHAREAQERSRLPSYVRVRVDFIGRLWFQGADIERMVAEEMLKRSS